ncbi:MAG: ribosome-associated translation inhibitor RaiA [Phycisphaerales bacterium]
MRIDVIGRHVQITDPIREHAESKGSKLVKYFDRILAITYTIFDPDPKGEFKVEVVVDVEHHDDFVSQASGDDVYGAIDLATQKASRQLTDYKEKLKLGHRG